MLEQPDLVRKDEPAAEFDALLLAAVDAIVLSDVDGTIVAFNPAAERLFGYAAADVVGRSVELLMPEPYRSEHAGYMRRYLESGERRIIGIGREVEALKRDGQVFPAWLSVGEALHGSGVRHFVGIIRDLSAQRAAELERRALEARLAKVGRFSLLGEMAAGIAHEINQPLAAVATYSEAARRLLERDELDRESLEQACRGIAEQATRAGQVIDNLRNLIRRRDVNQEPLSLNALIRDTLSLIKSDAGAAGIPVSAQYADALPDIRGNAVQLQQVLLNLTHNAVDAMQDSPHKSRGILIRTGRFGDRRVCFAVSDHGPGIPVELTNDVFEPFVTTKGDGLGVGLSISGTIVEAHGGSLRYESTPAEDASAGSEPAGLTTFIVTLPVSEESSNE